MRKYGIYAELINRENEKIKCDKCGCEDRRNTFFNSSIYYDRHDGEDLMADFAKLEKGEEFSFYPRCYMCGNKMKEEFKIRVADKRIKSIDIDIELI